MNKVFKVKFNKSTGVMAVVSELVRSLSKQNKARLGAPTGMTLGRLLKVATLSVLSLSVMNAYATYSETVNDLYKVQRDNESVLEFGLRGIGNQLNNENIDQAWWTSQQGVAYVYGGHNTIAAKPPKKPFPLLATTIFGYQNVYSAVDPEWGNAHIAGKLEVPKDIFTNVFGSFNLASSGNVVLGQQNDASSPNARGLIVGKKNLLEGHDSTIVGMGNTLKSSNVVVVGNSIIDKSTSSAHNVYVGDDILVASHGGLGSVPRGARFNTTVIGSNINLENVTDHVKGLTIVGSDVHLDNYEATTAPDFSGDEKERFGDLDNKNYLTVIGANTSYSFNPDRTAGFSRNAQGQVAGKNYQWQSSPKTGVMALGNGDARYTRITGVAPGLIAEGSTDAITGSQIHALFVPVKLLGEAVSGTNGLAKSELGRTPEPLSVHNGDQLTLKMGRNIEMITPDEFSQAGPSFSLATKADSVFNSATFRKDGAYEGDNFVKLSSTGLAFNIPERARGDSSVAKPVVLSADAKNNLMFSTLQDASQAQSSIVIGNGSTISSGRDNVMIGHGLAFNDVSHATFVGSNFEKWTGGTLSSRITALGARIYIGEEAANQLTDPDSNRHNPNITYLGHRANFHVKGSKGFDTYESQELDGVNYKWHNPDKGFYKTSRVDVLALSHYDDLLDNGEAIVKRDQVLGTLTRIQGVAPGLVAQGIV